MKLFARPDDRPADSTWWYDHHKSVAIMKFPPSFILEAGDFSILATPSDPNDWCEFEIISNNSWKEKIGGQNRVLFYSDFSKILKKESGRWISTISNANFKDVVGDDVDYLGSVSLSGYKTFYFFRDVNGSTQIVLSDGAGLLLKHFKFDIETCNALVGQCESILSSSF